MNKLFAETSKELEAIVSKAVDKSCHQAARMKTRLKDDYAVRVQCYGQTDNWKSAYLAYRFYKFCAMCCEGCEAERYWSIVCDLELGRKFATDEESYRRIA